MEHSSPKIPEARISKPERDCSDESTLAEWFLSELGHRYAENPKRYEDGIFGVVPEIIEELKGKDIEQLLKSLAEPATTLPKKHTERARVLYLTELSSLFKSGECDKGSVKKLLQSNAGKVHLDNLFCDFIRSYYPTDYKEIVISNLEEAGFFGEDEHQVHIIVGLEVNPCES